MRFLSSLALLMLGLAPLRAVEHHGFVRFGGLPLPGATVTATQGDHRFSTITGEQGRYSFRALDGGTWTIHVEMQCFSPQAREIEIVPGAPPVTWELKLLPRAQVHVERNASGVSSAAAAGASQPVSPGNPANEVKSSTPGKKETSGPTAANTSTPFQSTSLNTLADAGRLTADDRPEVGEMQSAAVDGLLINGSANNSASSPFAQAPAFGNFLRMKRNLYNSSLGVSLGNSALDARPFSLTGRETSYSAYSHVTGSVSFGGPLQIPHLAPRGRGLMFYVGYQWIRNRDATTANGLMPDPAERGGDLSQARTLLGQPIQITDPSNGLPLPGNRVPADRISPQARYLLSLYPLPGFDTVAGYNYQVPLLRASHRDVLRSNMSRSVSRKDSLFGTLLLDSAREDKPGVLGFLDTSRSRSVDATATWTRTLGPRTHSRFAVQWKRLTSRAEPYFANRENVSGNAGITGNNQEPVNWGPPSLSFSSGITALSDGLPSLTRNQTFGFSFVAERKHRKHSLRFGVDFSRLQFNHLSQQNPRGVFGFNGAATGFDFADYLFGIPDTSSIAFGNADKYFRSTATNPFVTDDWRVGPGLTVTAGLRWEYSSPMTERYGRLVNLEIARGFTAQAPVVAAAPVGGLTGYRYPDSLLRPDRRMLEPRLAIAWRPLAVSALVIRAGYGIYADTSVYESIAAKMAQQAPLSKSLTVQNSPANRLSLASGFNAQLNTTPNTFAVDPSFRVGYAQNWQFSLQGDLPGGLVATAGYLGTKGTHAQQAFYPNTYPAGGSNPCLSCPSGFEYLSSGGNSARHAAQFRLRRRLHSGLAASAQYTWAKAIDNAALGGASSGIDTMLVAQNWLALNEERSLSSFDQRHLVEIQFQYSTGTGIRGGTLLDGWRGHLFKDWTLTSQITVGSGLPLTPIYPGTVEGTGFSGNLRPDYAGAPLYSTGPGLVLNPAAYTAPQAGRWGNAGRNSITGPPQFTWNASVMRTFRLTDRFHCDLRADSINPLNHVTFGKWETNINSAQFGRPISPNSMRTIRTSLQVGF